MSCKKSHLRRCNQRFWIPCLMITKHQFIPVTNVSSAISFSRSTRAMGHPQHIYVRDYVFPFASQTQMSLRQQFHIVQKCVVCRSSNRRIMGLFFKWYQERKCFSWKSKPFKVNSDNGLLKACFLVSFVFCSLLSS